MPNPFEELDWNEIAMISFGVNTVTYRLRDATPQTIEFDTQEQMEAALAAWERSRSAKNPEP